MAPSPFPAARVRSLRTLVPVLAFAACAAFAVAGAAAPGAPAPQGCGRFTLEKIPLDATQAQVEALGIGKLEPQLVGTEESHFRVHPPHTKKQISILFRYGRVTDVTFFQYANAPTAETFLADVRSRWGEPDKISDTDHPKDLPMGFKLFTWSERTCPAYGGYLSTGSWVTIVLSTSVNHVKGLANERPDDAR